MQKGNGRSPYLFIGGALLLGLAAVLLIFGGGLFNKEDSILEPIPSGSGEVAVAQADNTGGFLEVGDAAPNFHLPDLEGNTVSLEDFRGRPLILNFWATWCAPCRLEMPALQAAQDAHQEEGLVVLAINSQETGEAVTGFFDELGLTITMTPLLDREGKIADLYHIINFPTTYFLNEEGEITAVHRGLLVEEDIEGYLTAILPDDS